MTGSTWQGLLITERWSCGIGPCNASSEATVSHICQAELGRCDPRCLGSGDRLTGRRSVGVRHGAPFLLVRTFLTSSRARGARRAGAGRRSWRAPRAGCADPGAAQFPPVAGQAFRGTLRAWAPPAALRPCRATAASARESSPRPAALAPHRIDQRRARELQEQPSSRRSSVKPGKITRKSASRHT
jgi:hypothetical protein